LIQVVAGLHAIIDVRVTDRVIEHAHDDRHLADGLVKVVVVLRPQLSEAPGDEVDLVGPVGVDGSVGRERLRRDVLSWLHYVHVCYLCDLYAELLIYFK
jgi:hypothetical protein